MSKRQTAKRSFIKKGHVSAAPMLLTRRENDMRLLALWQGFEIGWQTAVKKMVERALANARPKRKKRR